MSLELYYHPLASFCWKVLLALYENATPFEGHIVDLADEASRAKLDSLWPVGKFPVLHDTATGRTVPESSIIIEYLDQYYPGGTTFIPRELSLEVRLQDRFFDFYVHQPMQKIVADRLRPTDAHDPLGVEQAKGTIHLAYGMLERRIGVSGWVVGDAFSLADCAAMPALYYADRVAPLGDAYPRASAYLGRLLERPAAKRVLAEAQPYFRLFPG